jgi:hypothetical protein
MARRGQAHDSLARTFSVSDSEILVLRYLPTNLSTREIANELYISPSTVKTHIHHLYAGGHQASSCSVWGRWPANALTPEASSRIQVTPSSTLSATGTPGRLTAGLSRALTSDRLLAFCRAGWLSPAAHQLSRPKASRLTAVSG